MNLKDIEAQYASSAESSDSDSEAEIGEEEISAFVEENMEGTEQEEKEGIVEESNEENIP